MRHGHSLKLRLFRFVGPLRLVDSGWPVKLSKLDLQSDNGSGLTHWHANTTEVHGLTHKEYEEWA